MGQSLEHVVRVIRQAEGELRRRGILHLAVFGSVARGEDREDSDVDIAVDVEPGHPMSLIGLEDTRLMLEDALGRKVDLGETSSFRPKVREAFDSSHVEIF